MIRLFPIYNNALNEVTNGDVLLSEAFDEYALWRYFTGERYNPNLNYFNQGASYCASNISNLQDSLYTFYTNTGGVYYFPIRLEIGDLQEFIPVDTNEIKKVTLWLLILKLVMNMSSK